MQDSEFGRRALLHAALSAACPLWAAKIRGYDDAACRRRAHAAGQIIGCYGDRLMFRCPKPRNTSALRDLIGIWLRQDAGGDEYRDPFKPSPSSGELFNVLAEGIAIAHRLTGSDADVMLMQLFRNPDNCR